MRAKQLVRVAIVGTGAMANVHAQQFKSIPHCKISAACDVDASRVAEFAQHHGIEKTYTKIEDLLEDDSCDAVSIITPDSSHTPLSLVALAAGRHVLCEKPLALNYRDAEKMVKAAEKSGLVNMVNFTYRNWSCLHGAAAAIADGTIGEIRHVEASYLQAWLVSKAWGDWRISPTWLWRLSSAHGSKGVLGDVGVHILDFVTYSAGAIRNVNCRLRAFPKAPNNKIGEYTLDANDSAVMHVEFAHGALGVVHMSRWIAGHPNRIFLKIAGTKGCLEIDSDRSTNSFRICAGRNVDKAKWVEKQCKPVPTNHQKFIDAIRKSNPDVQPDFARGAEVQKILDACFKSDSTRKTISV